MKSWSKEREEDLSLLLKDWLKLKGRTQADLSRSLNSVSSRMPAILEVLKDHWNKGGISNVVEILCDVEESWDKSNQTEASKQQFGDTKKEGSDPFGQLDFLIEAIKEDCDK